LKIWFRRSDENIKTFAAYRPFFVRVHNPDITAIEDIADFSKPEPHFPFSELGHACRHNRAEGFQMEACHKDAWDRLPII
jgi:hypothetical protein